MAWEHWHFVSHCYWSYSSSGKMYCANVFHTESKAKRGLSCLICCPVLVLPSLHDVKVETFRSDLCSKYNIQNDHRLCQSHSIVYSSVQVIDRADFWLLRSWLLYSDVNVHVTTWCIFYITLKCYILTVYLVVRVNCGPSTNKWGRQCSWLYHMYQRRRRTIEYIPSPSL